MLIFAIVIIVILACIAIPGHNRWGDE